MNLLDFLFKLISDFLFLPEAKVNQMRSEADEWAVKMTGKVEKEDKVGLFARLHVMTTKDWRWRLGLALAFIPLRTIFMELQRGDEIEPWNRNATD